MELLRDIPTDGFPLEYLLARLKGRRRYLVDDWPAVLDAPEPLAAVPAAPYRPTPGHRSAEEVWQGMQRECAWVYGQLGPQLRARLAPFFLYLELRTLVFAVRHRQSGDTKALALLLARSLLAGPVQRLLTAEPEPARLVARLAEELGEWAGPGRSLAAAYRERGVAGFEERLFSSYLARVTVSRLHPAMAEFFRLLIDGRNVVILAKYRRWRLPGASFIIGGGIRLSRLQQLAAAGEAREEPFPLWGEQLALTAGNLETRLLTRLSRLVGRLEREPTGVGCVLAYLWRCAMEARNLSLLVHGADMDRDSLLAEVVQ
jgi:ATP synthase C subunit